MRLVIIPAILLLVAGSSALNAQTTWSSAVLPGAPFPSDLLLNSQTSGTNQFDLTLGAGGSLVRMRANRESNKEMIPYGTSPTGFNTQWSVQGPVAFDDGDAATDDRFILNQAGTSNPWLAPVMQVEKNALTQAVDVYSVPQDQWNPGQQAAVKTKFSSLVRYEPQSDGSIKVRRVIRFGDVSVNGSPWLLATPFYESQNSFPAANYNMLATSVNASGNILTSYTRATDIPQNQQTDVTLTNGYAVVYSSTNVTTSSAMGIVFGKQPMTGPNQCVVNYSDDANAISVRPGIQLANVSPGAVLEVTSYLVPGYGVNSALASRLSALVAATPAPVLYPAGTTFTGEMATIVQRLNDNLALKGVRTDRLGHDVTPAPVTARPMLLCSPEENADIIARLAAFPQTPESLLNNYLYGTAAQKQAATTYFFRYPGSGDGNGLRTNYSSITGRHMMWDLQRYDIALGLGYATQAQKDLMMGLAEDFLQARFTSYSKPEGEGGGNLRLEDYTAMGLAGLNFPDHPNAQYWLSRAVTNVKKIVDTYFPDGAGTESPRYHDWSLEQLAIFLPVLQRRVGIDLYDEPGVRSALEWLIRFSSPPVSLTSNKSVTPAWGDSTYSSNAGTHYYYNLGLFAPYYRQRDPDFSARLMGWWTRNGRPRDVYSAGTSGLSNILLFDARLPDAPVRPNTSTYSPRIGHATLRSGSGTDDEFFATFKCGTQGAAHQEGDVGHLDLFAFGVPLALDSTCGPYDSVAFNPATAAHNSVRFNGVGAWDSVSGSFSAFGTSPSVDYAVGDTNYGTVSNRHLVMMKGDYLVVWDETTASNYADWFFRVPGTATLDWQPHKVVSSTPWGVNLDVHFVLPAEPLVAPTFSGSYIPTGDTTALRNEFASQATDPAAPGMFTMMGENRFGDGSTSRNPFPFQWLKYISVRNASSAGDFLTVMHPRKVGVTPELTTELVSSSATAVTLRVTYNGRVDTIAFTSSGATVTKGSEPSVQFTKSWPQSGVSGTAGYVKADFYTAPVTTLTSALTTTGPVEVHTGELALGAANRIPNTATLMVKPGAAFNTTTYNETVGTLLMNGGVLKGTGTLTTSSIEWWGGIVTAPVSSSGNFVKKGGDDWSRPANLTYAGDTVIESGNLAFKAGTPALPGTGRVLLRDGTGLKLDGISASISGLDVTGSANLTTGTGTLAITGALTGTGLLVNSGNLNLSAVTSVANTLTLQSNGLLTLPGGPLTVKRLIINGVTLPAGVAVSAATHPGQIAGTGTITPLEDIPVPTGLSGSATLGQISLSWNAVPGVSGYTVRRSTTPGGPYSDIATPAAASFNDTLVTDAVVYYYVVAARDATGFSANSPEISITAVGPWYFDPNGTTAGSVANAGSYTWVSSSWTKTPGGTAATEASGPLRHVQFAATSPGLPLAYSVGLAGFSGAAHGFRSMRVTQGNVTFTGTPGNFYFTQPPTITADAGATIRFAQIGALAFNLNLQNVTFDGAGTTLVSNDTVILNTGSITKSGTGTLVLAAPNTYNGTTTINGGTLRLATTDLPALWLDATKPSSLVLADGAASQWNDANGRGTFVSQATAANRPVPVTDNTLTGPAKSLVDFGAFSTTAGKWMQMGANMTDIRALFWVGKTTNENFLLGSTTVHDFHSGGPGSFIWSPNTSYSATNIRNGTTWLNGTAVTGTTTIMPASPALVRIATFTAGNVNANTLGNDRAIRYGGVQPGEVMVFNSVLTSQQQIDIDAYLAKKWSNIGTGIGNRLPTNTMVSLSNGATLDLTGINFQTIAGLEANDNTATRVDLGAAALTISAAGSSSFDGVISGSGSLFKNGSGAFTLLGNNTYTGPTTVEGGTLVVENSITSSVTVKTGGTLVNNGTITGDVIIESGGNYLGEGTITGTITTSPPVVTITSPGVDNIVLPDLATDLNLTASIVFNSAFGTPAVSWTMVNGPGSVTFENPGSATTTARFSATGSYTLRCTATVTVNGQLMQDSADRIVQPGGPTINNFTATFREGENSYTQAATFIRGDSVSWNSGARDQFLIGYNNSGGMRGLFAFDLAAVPSGATITSAAFDLWISATGTSTVSTLELRPLLKDFVEGTGNGSSDTNGANSGADWNSRTGPTTANLWGVVGGQSGTDFSSTVIGSLAGFNTTTTAGGTKMGFTLAPAFVTEASAALSAARPLRFMLTMAGDTSGSNRFARFASDDNTTTPRPQLTIHYSTGNPAVPTVNPGTAPTAIHNVAATLSGTISNASGGSQWSLVSGPGDATFTDASQPATTVSFSAAGSYVLRLSATNAHGASSRTLAVTVALNPGIFSDWQAIHWPGISDPATIGETADPNRDGESNLLEFATSQNPHAASRALTSVAMPSDNLEFTYQRSRSAFIDGYVFTVEYTDDLAVPWTPFGPGDVITDGPTQTVKAVIPSDVLRRFARLKVTHP